MRKLDFWHICIYLMIYSIAGFIIETVFGMVTKGVLESRKSFLYGPFCAIYGIGATLMIVILKNEKNIWKIFIKGAIIGAVTEYAMSLFCEKVFGVKWWDYSDYLLNINGRTCLLFAFFWGILAIVLIKLVNPYVNKAIDFFYKKEYIFKIVTICLISFIVFDIFVTSCALKIFYYRVSAEKNLNIENKSKIEQEYSKIKNDSNIVTIIEESFSDEKMLKTYPNLMIQEKNDNVVYIDSLFSSVKPYYFKLGIN